MTREKRVCAMYENENYTNNYSDVYQTSSSSPEMRLNEEDMQKKEKKPKKQGPGGFLKKTMACVSLGLCFGLCAGLGFYAVEQSTGMFSRGSGTQMTSGGTVNPENGGVTNVADSGADESKSGIPIAQPVNMVTYDASDVVKQVMPAMVSIVNNFDEELNYFGQTLTQKNSASGSGIIVGESETELLVATNYHVVADATSLLVHFIDGTEAEASIKGTDSSMDLAVIAIPLDSLTEETKSSIAIATLGKSDNLEMGQPVIAIGNALGYGQSVTGGYVSALDREIQMTDGATGTFIQTDAAINPGNSGGALLNLQGEVIGINSNKIGGTAIEGMGYAIPISAAQPILEELMLKETRALVSGEQLGYIGILPQSVTEEDAQRYGMPKGIFVYSVVENGPASAAGILRGDILTEFDGNTISSNEELQSVLKYYSAGETIDLTVMRYQNGEYVEFTIGLTLGSKPVENQ